MKLSILDPSPVPSGQTPGDALNQSVELARLAENLGYTRFWMTEHHDLDGIAGSVPEVTLPYIGAHTSTIRLGTGAVLLPYYKPYKVAEIHNMLATLFPGRIDLGIGRAPGGSAEAANALSDNYLQNAGKMPELTRELLQFIDDKYPSPNEHAPLSASPVPEAAPAPWMLGTSRKSAMLAAECGTAYAFAQFMSDKDGAGIVQQYRDHFIPRKPGEESRVIVAVSAVCAQTSEQAENIAYESCKWSVRKEDTSPLTQEEKKRMAEMRQHMMVGNPAEIKEQLIACQSNYGTDEIMIISTILSPEEREESYRRIAKEILQQ
ncbi:LLM class flavin-dependent oxidoreductase [Salibacterium aidingense]|uniref:LLM class flavin-dependent oxidoreductase n=1 Tax=Salibacterium aidingense TaxID=384933 RepID=UPI003BC896C9